MREEVPPAEPVWSLRRGWWRPGLLPPGDSAALRDAPKPTGKGTPLLIPDFSPFIFPTSASHLAQNTRKQRTSEPGRSSLRHRARQGRGQASESDDKEGTPGSRSGPKRDDGQILVNLQGTVDPYDM